MKRTLNILRHFEKRKRVRNIHFVSNKAPFLVQELACPKKEFSSISKASLHIQPETILYKV